MKEQLKVLIPAAGFGLRAGAPEAKEMLPGPEGAPMIDWSLDYARAQGWSTTVATRLEKLSLVNHLRERGVETLLLEPTREWPETILRTQAVWKTWNLLLLPDCRFEPESVLQRMWEKAQYEDALKGEVKAFVATFPVLGGKTWGCVAQGVGQNPSHGHGQDLAEDLSQGRRQDREKICSHSWWIAEKPHLPFFEKVFSAWGVWLFHKDVGVELFESCLKSQVDHSWQELSFQIETFSLDKFEDLTRTQI